MTKTIVLAALAASALAAPAAAQTRLPAAVVAVVDLQRVLTECTACRTATSQLQGMLNTLQTRQQNEGPAFETEAQSVQKAVAALPAAQRNNPPAALKARIAKLQQTQAEFQNLQQTLQSTKAHVDQQLSDKLDTIYPTVMASKGATVLVEKGNVLASSSGIDVTNDLLATLNAQLPAVSVTPMPQQAQPARPAATTPATTQPVGR